MDPNTLSLDFDTAIETKRMETHSQIMNPRLCSRCQVWDDIWSWPFERYAYVSLEELSQSVHCIICQAVATVGDTRRRESESLQRLSQSRILIRNNGPYFLDRGPGWGNLEPFRKAPHRIHSSDAAGLIIKVLIHLDIIIEFAESELPDDLSRATPTLAVTPQFCLRYSSVEPSHLVGIEPWEVTSFDISVLKTWIKGCEEVHGRDCVGHDQARAAADLPAGFRVIDVQSMTIVAPSKPVRFAALSYMWQQSGGDDHAQLELGNLKELEALNGVDKIPLPSIISDAICLCRDLGETYLWVDRLCIIQDDPRSKHGQIQSMDKIYRSATLAIIAALNIRDGGGLPGFRGRPRRSSIWSPPRDGDVETRGIRPNAMGALVDPSLWNKRGWTFQERVLSRRRLFITEFQTVFECSRGHASEELTYYPPRPFDSYQPDEAGVDELEYQCIPAFEKSSESDRHSQIAYSLSEYTSLVDYFFWIEDYTARQLSFGTDILSAFAGVGNALKEALGSSLVFGLPEKYMSQTLMWSCSGLAERRADTAWIPSWSWASSTSRADYFWINGDSSFTEDMVKIISLVIFYFQDPDLGLRKLDVEERWIHHVISIEEIGRMSGVPELEERKYTPANRRSNDTWRGCLHNPWQTLAHSTLDPDACDAAVAIPGSLIFNTTVASLKLQQGTQDRYRKTGSSERDIAICRQNGELVGWLHKMSPGWIDKHVDGEETHDFIVICGALADWRARKTRAQYLNDFDVWNLYVMLIERSPFKPCVARRVDVGVVFAHKWKDCNPRWETIVLC